MAGRSRTTFQKRQKEMARQEKRQLKVQRREERKAEKKIGGSSTSLDDMISEPEEAPEAAEGGENAEEHAIE